MKDLLKPSMCPECEGTEICRIFGGRPTPEAWEMVERGEAVLGSCFLNRKWSDWRCMKCNHEWYNPDDPARQEMEALLEKILTKLGR